MGRHKTRPRNQLQSPRAPTGPTSVVPNMAKAGIADNKPAVEVMEPHALPAVWDVGLGPKVFEGHPEGVFQIAAIREPRDQPILSPSEMFMAATTAPRMHPVAPLGSSVELRQVRAHKYDRRWLAFHGSS